MNRGNQKSKVAKRSAGPRSVTGFFLDRGVRETIESILVAIMLALLFRTFEAEAFVIPTGSMAPTLMGRHKDVQCDECGIWYRTGASSENPENAGTDRGGIVMESACPICHYPMLLDPESEPNERSFSGDRILVDKLAYIVNAPERWDVIVFKYPGNAKQNYIKRLIGLPNEEIKILHGDIYAAPVGTDEFVIQPKPHRKLQAMLQIVDDTDFIPATLKELEWPSRWDEWGSADSAAKLWEINDQGEHPVFSLDNGTDDLHWLRYRHLAPNSQDWETSIDAGRLPPWVIESKGTLITDFYAYNDYVVVEEEGIRGYLRARDEIQQYLAEDDDAFQRRQAQGQDANEIARIAAASEMHSYSRFQRMGLHWVGDLAAEFDLEVQRAGGQIVFDLVEGGVHFQCSIDLGNGTAVVTASDPNVMFLDTSGKPIKSITAATPLSKAGTFDIRYANADNRIYLWVNNKPIEFNATGAYSRDERVLPKYSESDPGDAEPIGVGVKNAAVSITRARVFRDIYYTQSHTPNSPDYRVSSLPISESESVSLDPIYLQEVLQTPEIWELPAGTTLFESLYGPTKTFPLTDSQYFPLGDNSPASQDARIWDPAPSYVEADLMIGKALFVYWPHSWNRPVPFLPNFQRMGFIR